MTLALAGPAPNDGTSSGCAALIDLPELRRARMEPDARRFVPAPAIRCSAMRAARCVVRERHRAHADDALLPLPAPLRPLGPRARRWEPGRVPRGGHADPGRGRRAALSGLSNPGARACRCLRRGYVTRVCAASKRRGRVADGLREAMSAGRRRCHGARSGCACWLRRARARGRRALLRASCATGGAPGRPRGAAFDRWARRVTRQLPATRLSI